MLDRLDQYVKVVNANTDHINLLLKQLGNSSQAEAISIMEQIRRELEYNAFVLDEANKLCEDMK